MSVCITVPNGKEARKQLEHYGAKNIHMCLNEFQAWGVTKFHSVKYGEVIVRIQRGIA